MKSEIEVFHNQIDAFKESLNTYKELISPGNNLRTLHILELLGFKNRHIRDLRTSEYWYAYTNEKPVISQIESKYKKFICSFPSKQKSEPNITISSLIPNGISLFTVNDYDLAKELYNDIQPAFGHALTILLVNNSSNTLKGIELGDILVRGLSYSDYTGNYTRLVDKESNIFRLRLARSRILTGKLDILSASYWRKLGIINGYLPFARVVDNI